MTLNDLLDDEPAILAQDKEIGIPDYEELRQSPNTRWIDKYTDEYGKSHGGYYGSISDYDESFMPKIKYPVIEENPYPHYPIYMTEGEPAVEEEEEESPMVLEGGVEENVYYPEEEQLSPEEEITLPEEEQKLPPEDDNESMPDKNKFDLDDDTLLNILQGILKDFPSTQVQKAQVPEIWDDNQNNTFNILTQSHNVTLPNAWQYNQTTDLEKFYKELLEELRKKMRLGRWLAGVYNTGNITGGAADIKENNKADFLQGIFNDYKSIKDPSNTALYVLGEFLTNYNSMKDADVYGGDKYFHAKANYEAAQQGIVGSVVAKIISDLREWSDSYRNIYKKGYTPEFSRKDSEEDQKANEEGRKLGRKYPTKPPYEALEHLKPNGLPERYQKRW